LSEATPDRDRDVISVRTEGWKYIEEGQNRELYDLESDPGERENAVEAHSDVAQKMRELVRTHLNAHKRLEIEETEVDVDEEAKRRLKALGYYD
jgi:hypothetical protein